MREKYLLIIPFLFIIIIIPIYLKAQDCIPDSRNIDWKSAGLLYKSNTSPDHWIFIDQLVGNDTEKILTAIDSANSMTGNTIIYFQSGNYYFDETITIDKNPLNGSITLLGNISEDFTSTITFQGLDVDDDCFIIKGQWAGDEIRIMEDLHKGDSVIVIENADDFQIGDWIRFSEPNFDDNYSSLSDYIGQVSQITSIEGNSITFKDNAAKNYSSANQMWIRKMVPTSNIGFENLKIERDNSSKGYGKTFYFYLAINCWMEGVESYNCTGYHVNVNQSSHIKISGCYIHKATNYDSDEGTGYGVVLGSATTNCLIENNIFIKTRHAMLVGTGANTNVFAYNFSSDATWDYDPTLPGDIRLHGRFPYSNLFEGNSVDYVFGDPTHGDNGPYNTFFRNHVRSNYIKLFNADSSNVGGNYLPNGIVDFEPNWLEALAWPDVTKSRYNFMFDDCMEVSLFYNDIPDFFLESDLFPSVETNNLLDQIPARKRYLNDEFTYYVEQNFAPTLVDTIPDIMIEEDSDLKKINLVGLVWDINLAESEIIKSIISNTSLLVCEVVDDSLSIQLVKNAFGFSEVVVEFDCENDIVLDTFSVTILPVNDAPWGRDTTIYHFTYEPFVFSKEIFPYWDIESDSLSQIEIVNFNLEGILSYYGQPRDSSFFVQDFKQLTLSEFEEFSIEYYLFDSDSRRSDSSYTMTLIKSDTSHGFMNSMPDTSINENCVFYWQFTNDSISKYSIHSVQKYQNDLWIIYTGNPPTIDSLTGEFLWQTDYDDVGEYEIIIKKTKFVYIDFDTTLITIEDVNRPPIFTKMLSDTTINNTTDFQYQYFAKDADDDSLLFGLVSQIDSLEIDINGLLIWNVPRVPEFEYQIIVFVTDREDTVFSSANVKIENVLTFDNSLLVPKNFALYQNYPNPFNPTTTINYEIPYQTSVTISIYNVEGKLVEILSSQVHAAGFYTINWNASEVPSGVYFYRLESKNYTNTRSMILVK